MGGLRRVIDRIADAVSDRADMAAVAGSVAAAEAPLRAAVVADEAIATLVGMGPLDALLADPDVSDVLVNRPDEIWVERNGSLELTAAAFPGPEAVIAAVERSLLPLGLRLDRLSPAVDARLPDGSRLHALIPPAAVDGPVVAIRRFTTAVVALQDLVVGGSITKEGARTLERLVVDRNSLLVSGGTGAGKTTLLNVLSRLVPAGERVVTIEEAAELDLEGHVVRLESRAPNAEGAGEIPVRALVRHALRMRPDRIIVGEVRGAEAFDLIQAMSTGHAGSMGTVHASGPDQAMWRVETLAGLSATASPAALHRMLHTAVDTVVHVERDGTVRRVRSISSVMPDSTEVVWEW